MSLDPVQGQNLAIDFKRANELKRRIQVCLNIMGELIVRSDKTLHSFHLKSSRRWVNAKRVIICRIMKFIQ